MFRLLKIYKLLVFDLYMKLQKRLSRRYKDKLYYKYIIVIPEEDIAKSGIKEGNDLISSVKRGEITLRKQDK